MEKSKGESSMIYKSIVFSETLCVLCCCCMLDAHAHAFMPDPQLIVTCCLASIDASSSSSSRSNNNNNNNNNNNYGSKIVVVIIGLVRDAGRQKRRKIFWE
jgi:hypothetical protein